MPNYIVELELFKCGLSALVQVGLPYTDLVGRYWRV